MRNGGDGYEVFRTRGENAYDYGPGLETVLADYLAAHQPFKPYTDGRITEVAAAAGTTTAEPAAATDATAAQPAADAAATTPASGPQKHVIARGDTLWDLAKSFYGDGALWAKISEANGKPAPRRLHVGTELEIPAK
ncbi:LysM domain/BON superfamily protein [compost metagenome]